MSVTGDYDVLCGMPLELSEQQVWRMSGLHRGADQIKPAIREVGLEALELGRGLVRPQAIWRLIGLNPRSSAGLELEGGAVFSSPALGKLLRGAEWLAVGLVTVGPDLEAQVHRLLEQGDLLEGMLLDAVGSVAVGELADLLHRRISARASEMGLEVGPSLNPGTRFWPLEDQRVIFDLIPAGDIGVVLNDSCLMLPEKSESLAAGLGTSLKVKDSPGIACRICGRAICEFRAKEMVPG